MEPVELSADSAFCNRASGKLQADEAPAPDCGRSVLERGVYAASTLVIHTVYEKFDA